MKTAKILAFCAAMVMASMATASLGDDPNLGSSNTTHTCPYMAAKNRNAKTTQMASNTVRTGTVSATNVAR